MTTRKVLAVSAALLVGALLGLAAAWVIQIQGERSMAKANIYAAGEALRSGDLTMSMLYAQSVIAHAPHAYDGYEFVGDVYSKQGYAAGAKRMYELALQKLGSEGIRALLVQEGTNNVAVATELLQRKIAVLDQHSVP